MDLCGELCQGFHIVLGLADIVVRGVFEPVCRSGDSDLVGRLDNGERTSFCEVVRGSAIASKLGRALGQRLRPTVENCLFDLSTTDPLGIAAKGEFGLPLLRDAFHCVRRRWPRAELAQ